MDKLDKLFDRMTRDMLHYFIAGGLAEPDGLIRTVEFYLSFVDKGKLSEKLLDKQIVEDALIHHLPKHMPLYIDESFYAYQILLDLYNALYHENIISQEDCKELQFFIYLNKRTFLTRMSNPNFWSKTKLAIMDEWREGNFEIEDPYNVTDYELDKPTKKVYPDNILQFPKSNKQTTLKSYVVRVDLKGYKPPIWRRLKIPAGISYGRLHRILQVVFGWEDCHLHSFFVDRKESIGPKESGVAEFSEAERLIDEDFREGVKIDYLYDFSCEWEHQILVEKVNQAELEPVTFAVCLKAKGTTPAEDSKGHESWKDFDLVDLNKRLREE